jgi:predicted XRE-type DNA-binding protein
LYVVALAETWREGCFLVLHPPAEKVSMAVYTVVDIIHCMKTHLSHASVWDALADTPEQAANMRTRSELMQQIAAIVKENAWTQVEVAKQCGVTQPRINDLLRGRVSHFSLDALVNIATAIGRRVHVELEAA